jgi:hypothetical protein
MTDKRAFLIIRADGSEARFTMAGIQEALGRAYPDEPVGTGELGETGEQLELPFVDPPWLR